MDMCYSDVSPENVLRLPSATRKFSQIFFYHIGTEDHQKFLAVLQSLEKSPSVFITLSTTLNDNIMHALQCYIVIMPYLVSMI